MGYAQESGYTPTSIEEIMEAFRVQINAQFGTTYTSDTFVGTNFYKYYYAMAQKMQELEIKTSEIFENLQQYFVITNERISRPVVTPTGLIEAFEAADWVASVKPMIEGDAGKAHICVDVDDSDPEYEEMRAEICEIIKNSVVAGVVTMGTESEAIVLSNGQSFDFKYNLPDRTEVDLRLTITLSENNQVVVKSPEEVKEILMANIAAKYRLGRNFEPQRYFTIVDAPWASSVLLEWSDNGGGDWHDEVFEAEYDDLFEILLENISVVEA